MKSLLPLTVCALFAIARSASAGEAGSTPGIAGEAEKWLVAGIAGPTAASDPIVRPSISATADRAEAEHLRATAHRPIVDFWPHASLVVRDWRGSMQLIGRQTMLVDELRPLASNRMALVRVSTNDAWLKTFAQVGAGEWRIDTAMFPNARSYSEAAGQIGVGFELRLPRNLRIAGEGQYTILYGNLAYTADEVAPRMLAALIAIDGRF